MNVVLQIREHGEMQTRRAAPDPRAVAVPGSYDATARTVEAIVATDTPIRRRGFREVLVMSSEATDLSRAAAGRMPFLFNHNPDRPIGTVVSVSIKGGKLVAVLHFADTPEGRKAEGQVARSELPNFSIGYTVHEYAQRPPAGRADIERAAVWELFEISLVTIPADKSAVVRSQKGPHSMDPEDDTLEHEHPQSPAPAPATARRATRAERTRLTTLADIAHRAGLEQSQVDEAVENGTSIQQFRELAFDALVARQTPTSHIRVDRDETQTRALAMEQEVRRVLASEGQPRSDLARPFFGRSLVEMAAEAIGHRGRIPFDIGGREQIMRRAMHTTSDFPLMLENALYGRMAERYVTEQPTYRVLCRRRDVPDFRPQPYYRPGDLPALEKLAEAGRIMFGTISEGREWLMVAPYAIGVAFSRPLLVNDHYGAIDDVLSTHVDRVIAFENQLFWGVVLANAGAGPTLATTTRAVFNTTDGSLAASGAAPGTASATAGRAAMRKRKSLDGLFVQAEPKFIVGGADQETAIDQLLAAIIPNETGKANPFAGTLTKVIAPEISGNPWFLFADPQKVPTFVYSLLNGYKAPRLSFDEPFTSQGLMAKIEHDVGFSAVDFRGAWRNPGQ